MANSNYPYTQTVIKFSYKTHTKDSRFDHSELDTARYGITFNVPCDKGYVYNDFGYERVEEVKSKYQYQFERQSQDIIQTLHEELEAKLKSLKLKLEAEMAQELLVGVVPSKKKEAAE
jgi:hypothetical protein